MSTRPNDDKTWTPADLAEATCAAIGAPPPPFSPTPAGAEQTIGPYRLLAPLGEGGMGTVYRAEQIEPVKRQVALKVIRSGLDSAEFVARFEAERQALALMDHPNIARVFDAGATPAGLPYFVMELVLGVPLTRYADEARLTVDQRLALFLPICQAVQHAHQKGIIHRDLKPSNILVTQYDGQPAPKVIDFGMAKATMQRLSDRTRQTEFGQVLGTLQYMSPEQAGLNQLDVDTRTDIYSLGVVLYELLTGALPISFSDHADSSFVELLRRIHEDDPLRPSVRVGQLENAAVVATRRRTEPARLARELSRDLDWIVMKALAKDRSQRYETASALALDLGRYLAGEPVEAGPPSATYRLRKFVRRNRGAVAAAATILSLLLVGSVVSAVLAVKATRAERLARENEATARAEEQHAKESAAEALAVLSFFQNNVLAAARPEDQQGGLGIDATIREAVESAEPRVAATFAGQPLAEAAIRDTLGSTYIYLGEAAPAIKQLEQAARLRLENLGPDDPATLTSRSNLAAAYRMGGRGPEAIELYEKTVAKMKNVLGAEHAETLTCQGNLALAYQDAARFEEALVLFRQTWEQRTRQFGHDHPAALDSLNNLAFAHQASGRVDLALPWLEELHKKRTAFQGPDHPDTLTALNNLAMAHKATGHLTQALPMLNEAHQKRAKVLGVDHPNTLVSLNNLAIAIQEAGGREEALPLLLQVWEKRQARLRPNHPDTLTSQNNLALAYQFAGQLDKALPLFEQAHQGRLATSGVDHPDTLTSQSNLAMAYVQAEKPELAVPLLEAVVAKRLAQLGSRHAETMAARLELATAYQAVNQIEQTVPLLEQVWEYRQGKLGREHASTLSTQNNLAAAYKALGRTADAARLFRDAVETARASVGFEHASTQTFLRNLLVCYEQLHSAVQAEPYLRQLANLSQEKDGADSPIYARHLLQLGMNLLEQERYAAAEQVLRECLKIRTQQRPNEWQTFNTHSLLGASLAGQMKFAEAEPMLLQGYEGISERADKLNDVTRARLPEALARIVKLYEAWDKPEQAALWQKKLAELPMSAETPVK